MYRLIKTKDDDNEYDLNDVVITIHNNDITLDDLLETMTTFIKASGFYIDGKNLELVSEEAINEEERRQELYDAVCDMD